MDRIANRIVVVAGSTADRGAWRQRRRRAQAPDDPAAAAGLQSPRAGCTGCFTMSAHTVQDKFVGYPETFIEPPLGYYVNEQFAVQVSKADTHRFTLYRSDFCRERTCFLRAGRRGSTSCSPGFRAGGADHGRMDSRAARPGQSAARRSCRRCRRRASRSWPARRDRPVAVPGRDGSRGDQQLLEYRQAQPGARRHVPAVADRVGRHGSSLRCRSIDRPSGTRASMRGGTGARSIVIGYCLAAIALFGGGLRGHAATTRDPRRRPARRRCRNAPGAEVAVQDSADRSRTDFHAEATDRQRFRCTSTSGGSSSHKATSTGRCSNIKRPLRSSRPGGAGRFGRPTRHWRIGGWRVPSIGWDDLPRPRCITRRPSSSARKTRRSGTTPATVITSRAAGPTPSGHSGPRQTRPDDERIAQPGADAGGRGAIGRSLSSALPVERRRDRTRNLGYLLASTGQFDLARRQYETALAMRPDLELARRALTRLDCQRDGILQASTAPERKAQAARTAAAPVDAGVDQASSSRSTIPPPLPRRIPPGT